MSWNPPAVPPTKPSKPTKFPRRTELDRLVFESNGVAYTVAFAAYGFHVRCDLALVTLLVASFIPARRAASIDPVTSLRQE